MKRKLMALIFGSGYDSVAGSLRSSGESTDQGGSKDSSTTSTLR